MSKFFIFVMGISSVYIYPRITRINSNILNYNHLFVCQNSLFLSWGFHNLFLFKLSFKLFNLFYKIFKSFFLFNHIQRQLLYFLQQLHLKFAHVYSILNHAVGWGNFRQMFVFDNELFHLRKWTQIIIGIKNEISAACSNSKFVCSNSTFGADITGNVQSFRWFTASMPLYKFLNCNIIFFIKLVLCCNKTVYIVYQLAITRAKIEI